VIELIPKQIDVSERIWDQLYPLSKCRYLERLPEVLLKQSGNSVKPLLRERTKGCNFRTKPNLKFGS
jgi:hypothetical protein